MAMEQFSFGDIVLIDDTLRLPFQQSLLQGKKGMIGVSFLSLSAWIQQFQEDAISQDALLFAYRSTLHAHSAAFSIFQQQFDDVTFLKQCAQFIAELKLYMIDIATLPQRTDSEKELKQILSLLFPISSLADQRKAAMEKIEAMPDASHIWIYPSFFSLDEQHIIDILLKKGAHWIERSIEEETPAFYYAVNMRQEVEGIAQRIIANKQDAENIAVCTLDPFYESLIVQIFTRYQIPYTVLSSSTTNELSIQMQAWLHYLAKPEWTNLQNLLTSNVFSFDCDDLLRYLQLFQQDIDQPIQPRTSQVHANALLDRYTLQQLQQLEEKAIQQQQQLLMVLHPAQQLSPQEMLSFLCDFFTERYPHPNYAQIRCMKQIQQLFQEIYDVVHTKEDLSFLAQLLKEKQLNNTYDQLSGVLVHTIKELHQERTIRYVVGATMNAWPNFTARNGLFDERYCKALALPSMDERYQHHLKQCEKLYHAQKQLIISYPLGTYEGKNNEASLEIEQYMEHFALHAQALPLVSTHLYQRRTPHLDPAIAQQLYLQNGELRGSISAFERYRQCPFSYFLRYGLHLKKQKHTIDEAKIGSLIHELLQRACQQYGKAYVEISTQELMRQIQEECSTLLTLYPHREAALKQLEMRLTKQLSALFTQLASLEEHNHLCVRGQERPFTYTLPLSKGTLRMDGVIDRIDTSNHMAVILDYKSSKKTLSSTKVFSGLQLQLLTYAIVLEKGLVEGFEEIKEVLGAFYVSFKQESILQPALKIQRQKKLCQVIEHEDILEEQRKKQRLSGWIFSEHIDLFDDDATHVANLKLSNGTVVGRTKQTIRSLQMLSEGIQKILLYIGEQILTGEIACEPGEDACKFCDFHSICRFHGQPYPKTAIINDQMEYCDDQKEVESDAHME